MENKLPTFLETMLKKQYGEELTQKILEGYSAYRKVTLRVNTIKSSIQNIKQELDKNNIKYKNVSWNSEALIIENAIESDIQKLSIYENGEIYLQNLSSMLPPIILEPKENLDILDMAAAPGGKTTQIASITKNNANITALEINAIRTEKLKYNIEKQGASSVYIMNKDARQLDNFFSFDKILLDAPCSGSGTLNLNDKNMKKYFTEKLIEKSIKSQLALFRKAIKILKSGQDMVYSTCSILEEENENIVRKILSETNTEIVPTKPELINELPVLPTTLKGTLCVMPTNLYEGFFVVKLRKK